MKLILRVATINDLPILQHWDLQQHVIDSDPNDDWNWEAELTYRPGWREQLIAELDGKPIGFVQIIDPKLEQTKYWGDVPPNLRAIDIWIGEKQNLRKGYGLSMMKLALERCFSDANVAGVLIDPLEGNVKAHKFYERLGFRFIEKRTFGNDQCHVYRLERSDWTQV